MSFDSRPLVTVHDGRYTLSGWTDSAAYFRCTLTVERLQALKESIERAEKECNVCE